MDLNTIIGSLLGWLLIVVSILIGGSSLIYYYDAPSIVIVFGGAICSCMVAFPGSVMKALPAVLMKTLRSKSTPPEQIIATMVQFAEIARRDGILSLESKASEVSDEFILRGIQMAVDGTDPELIEAILEADLENQILRHQRGKALLDAIGKYAPAFGMIGTLVGLVAMLANMNDPSKIGPGMAVALLTTLYGALLSNLMFLPMADKLAIRSADEVLNKTIVIRGVMSIQAGDNPRIVERKLLTYLPPSRRAASDDESRKAA